MNHEANMLPLDFQKEQAEAIGIAGSCMPMVTVASTELVPPESFDVVIAGAVQYGGMATVALAGIVLADAYRKRRSTEGRE